MNNENIDLFSSILEMDIKEDTLLPEEDRQWCLSLNESLTKTLDDLNSWYDRFRQVLENMGHDYQVSWYDDGSCFAYPRASAENDLFVNHSFNPSEAVQQVAKSYNNACKAFQKRIISYFNNKYNINIPLSIDSEGEYTIKNQNRPAWEDVVQMVIAHLGGRSFADTAKDEIRNDFLQIVKKYNGGHDVSVKNKVMTIQNCVWVSVRFDGRHYIGYDANMRVGKIIRCLILTTDGEISGGIDSLKGYNGDYTDFSKWYEVNSSNIEAVKFYKNQRLDIKFRSPSAAQSCYDRLGLDVLEKEVA